MSDFILCDFKSKKMGEEKGRKTDNTVNQTRAITQLDSLTDLLVKLAYMMASEKSKLYTRNKYTDVILLRASADDIRQR